MFDFTTTHPAPVSVKLNGKAYDVPRFLLADFKAWAADRQNAAMQLGLSHLPDADAKARFSLYFQPPPADVALLADDLRSPEGIEYLLRRCFTAAGVPGETIEECLSNGDPRQLRMLVDVLASTGNAVSQLKSESNDPGVQADPTERQPPT